MKGAELPDWTVPVPPAAGNGTHRAARKNGAAAKHSAETAAAMVPVDATFVTTEAEPVDAPMWPLHPALWLQPEAAPATPAWTGLAPERHNRIAAPGFLHLDLLQIDTAPPDRPGALEKSQDPLRPGTCLEFPQSGLTLLGWDPRAVCRKEGGQ
jgi:hypothetical protein